MHTYSRYHISQNEYENPVTLSEYKFNLKNVYAGYAENFNGAKGKLHLGMCFVNNALFCWLWLFLYNYISNFVSDFISKIGYCSFKLLHFNLFERAIQCIRLIIVQFNAIFNIWFLRLIVQFLFFCFAISSWLNVSFLLSINVYVDFLMNVITYISAIRAYTRFAEGKSLLLRV